MKLFNKKVLILFILVCFITGAFIPQTHYSFAANNVFNPTFTYNRNTNKWDIKWTPIDGTATFSVTWHGPDGSLGQQADARWF